ncbi:MAG: non-ribosomal peptide synthetase, partial [Deltaproteobacteria bacterium]
GRPKAFLSILPPDGEEDLPEAVERAIAHCPIRRALPPLGALAEGSFLAEFPAEPIDLPIGPHDLAYIAFTSGSTGRPKGVRGLHGALSHFLPWMAEHFGLGQEDRFSMLSGLSHDPLHRDIFTPLVLGAEIAIPDPAMIGTPGALATWMREAGITVAHLTPAMAELVTGEGKETIPSLHHLFFLGDRLHPRDVEGMRQIAPNVTCVNLYGATETSRAVGYYVVPEHGVPEEIPAGRGIGDVQLLLLNPLGRPTALGEVGEIHVRSPFLCGGYLDDEGLTRTRFGTNPFRDDPADRIYKTGDLGRYLADGNVAFLGRRDGQIKLRGFRIELTEIARHLEAYPGIAEAEVLLHPLPAGEALVAYIAGDPERSAQADEIRAFLRTRLPDYMIPARFIPLSQLPRTPNGKIDRGALPLPQEIRPQTPFVPPRNPLETRLAEIFGQILNVEKVGVFDNFFELGGHSLLATQLLSRIRDAFQVELPLRTIFEAPHIAGLAEAVTAARADGPAAQPPPITRVSRESRKIRRVTQPTPPSPPKG